MILNLGSHILKDALFVERNYKMYVMMKVFDCYDMPKELRREFFDRSEAGNDCYVSYFLEADCTTMSCDKEECSDNCEFIKYNNIQKWLLENGAIPDEHVLIKHSW